MEMESLFPIFDEINVEDLFQIVSSIPCLDQSVVPDPFGSSPLKTTDQTKKTKVGKKKRRTSTIDDEKEEIPNENKKRKIIHRDVERQRRQEMATLYASLRSLIPQEFLKGKRSVSDHMHESVNYINHLQKKIQELSDKRDTLKRLTNSPSHFVKQLVGNDQGPVLVRPCWTGVEVTVDTSILSDHGLPLSTVIQFLDEEGLQIINCVSSKIKDRLLYTIQAEVNGGSSVDQFELQQRLTSLLVSCLH